MRLTVSIIALLLLLVNEVKAEEQSSAFFKPPKVSLKYKLKRLLKPKKQTEVRKDVAIVMAVVLGPFGVHRLYLGTETRVPLIYTLTLGGGFGVLPLTDIVAIITVDDLQDYVGNANVVMWIK